MIVTGLLTTQCTRRDATEDPTTSDQGPSSNHGLRVSVLTARTVCLPGMRNSSLFEQEAPPEEIKMRRRTVNRSQMGEPKHRTARSSDVRTGRSTSLLEWAKAVTLTVVAVGSFLAFVHSRKKPWLERTAADFSTVQRCNISSYPTWRIHELEVLGLSGCGDGLVLPEDGATWSRFASLRKIDLNNNSLTSLPDGMDMISSSLEILFLSENSFTSVPDVIGKLDHLRVLSLRGNKLAELSSDNLPTRSLVWLILTSNRIETVNPNVEELKLIRKLMLSHNKLEIIPSELAGCKNLELIRLSDNRISSMPIEVLRLPRLSWISMSGNPISTRPKVRDKLIPKGDIEFSSSVLGSGASGTVIRGKYHGEDVAVKVFKGSGSLGSDGLALDEAVINGIVDHRYAVSAMGVIPSDDGQWYEGMVMKLLRGTKSLGKVPSFDTVTRDEGPGEHAGIMSEDEVRRTIWNVASALTYLHSIKVTHGDVYLHNVMSDEGGVARLSDFGASFVCDGSELIEERLESIEVLAFGRLVQDLYSWHMNIDLPDSTITDEERSVTGRRRGNASMMKEGPMRDLVASILQPDQSLRPTFKSLTNTLSQIPDFASFAGD